MTRPVCAFCKDAMECENDHLYSTFTINQVLVCDGLSDKFVHRGARVPLTRRGMEIDEIKSKERSIMYAG
jgi:hypothetical protein